MNQAQIIQALLKAIPDPAAIDDLDTTTSRVSVRFSWSGHRYVVYSNLSVEEVINGMLMSSDRAALIQHCLKLSGR